jgi:hypothetical protein
VAVIGGFAGAVIVLALALVVTIAAGRRHVARHRPLSEVHKARFVRTGDPAELERSIQAALREDQERLQ